MTTIAAQRPNAFRLLVTLTFLGYAYRDSLGGAFRYYAPMVGLDALWFIPDLMSFVCFGYFVYQVCLRERNPIATLFVLNVVTALLVGAYYLNRTPAVMLSAVKMITPIFVGFLFRVRTFSEEPWWFRTLLTICMLLSVLGLLINPLTKFPWTGATFDTLGVTREAGKLWWQGSEVRYAGFGNDSTMAAYMTMVPVILLCSKRSVAINLILIAMTAVAVQISTSKTTLVVLFLFTVLYLSFMAGRKQPAILVLRRTAILSYLTILVPIILIIALQNFNLASIDPKLYSMDDRIQQTWQEPFFHVYETFPIGLLIGCGLGCYTYPQRYTEFAAFQIPLDNYYLVTYIMLGLPFIIYVLASIQGANSKDPVKLLTITLLNFHAITVQGYGPSFETLMLGLMVSDMFIFKPKQAIEQSPSRGLANLPPLVPSS